ncbi:MAG: transcriptional repressor LexA [Pyrinomonadaceae bacterium]|nr:transcriptional repressor LexA [Pyrinomonadaceae bacterium]
MQPRTQRQKEILDYITRFMERHGYEPSYAQVARHFGVSSKATIAKHIEALERRGLLMRRRENGAFGLSVPVEEASDEASCQVPLLGRVAAGNPLETEETAETISVPRFLLGRVRPEHIYALKVSGDSMIDEHICDGDIAIIENRTEAYNGEIVVALIDGSRATLKRLYRNANEVELRPANSNLAPIRLPAAQVAVQGIFRGLLRSVS